MMNTAFAEMLRYDQWANRTLFEACRSLSEEQLDTRLPGSSGSVRELLTHIVAGQQTLLLRSTGGQRSSWGTWPGFEALVDLAARIHHELMAVAEADGEDTAVDLPYMDKVYTFPKSFFLVQVLAHGVEHRTEIKVTLASLGVPTPDLDSWSYGDAAGFARERASGS